MIHRSLRRLPSFRTASPKTVAWLTLAIVSVAIAAWVALPAKTRTSASVVTQAFYQMPKEERIQICKSVPTVPVSRDDNQAVSRSLEVAIRDPHKVLSETMRCRLIETLSAHLLARAEHDSAAYLRLADSEHTRWLPEQEDRRWRIIASRYQYVAHESPKRTDPRGSLSVVMNYSLSQDKARIVGLGTGDHGAVICVEKVRSSERLVDNYITDPKDAAYWFYTGSTGSAVTFRVPERSFEEVVARDGWGVFVQAALLVRIERGRPILLDTRWFWDPAFGAWQCAQFQYKGPYLYAIEF